ncbi:MULTISPECIES: SAV_915 family protein [unclassified Actinomadura]|uniref:SAV_915 family protein n=1 Tax=unclassified Actinomadura TaxID=2626254 RepID=UPI0011EF2876|nr:SAV_915 family protein [Actinomadura sp. K4S16]
MANEKDVDSIEKLLNTNTPYAGRCQPKAGLPSASGGEAVQGASSALDASQSMYVPAHPLVRDGEVVIGYETRELEPGRSALPVFSSEQKLVEQLGAVQPWVTIRLETLVDLMGARFLAVDPTVDPDAERWTAREAAEHEALIRRELGRSS